MKERLQKYMARCGIASRRKCEEMIISGMVKVNGTISEELGCKIDTDIDSVEVLNKKIKPIELKIYIALNKPTGYVSTCSDEKDRKTIIDLIDIDQRIFNIGRLDYDTSGLLLMTNDGEIYNKVIHPRQVINKEYIALIKGIPTIDAINRFCSGLDIGGYITSNASFEILKKFNNTCNVRIIIHEGKNRQIRKMCEKINHPVLELKRVSVGNVKLGNLKEGKWRYLNESEIKYLNCL